MNNKITGKHFLITLCCVAIACTAIGMHSTKAETRSTESVSNIIQEGLQSDLQQNNSKIIDDDEVPAAGLPEEIITSELEDVEKQLDEQTYKNETEEDTNNEDENTEDKNTEDENNEDKTVEIENKTPEYTYETEDSIKYAFCSLNVRNKPDASGEKIGTFGEGEDIHVVARCNETGWYKVEYGGGEGFVSDKYLLNEPVAVEEVETPVTTVTTNGPFTGVNGASDAMVDYANQKWNEMVPENIRNRLIEAGYKFYVDKGSLSQRFGFPYSVCGVTAYETKEVFLAHSKASIRRAMTHEMGHAVDNISGMPSYSAEFSDIYLAEKDCFHDYSSCGDGSETVSSLEYFASVFDNIVNNPEQTQREVPRSYEFVSRYM